MKGPIAALAITLVMAITGCGSGLSLSQAPPDQRLFNLAEQAFATGKDSEAVVLVETLIDTYPESQFVEPAKRALEDCDHRPNCSFIRAQIERCPSAGGCQTFFPPMKSQDLEK